MTYNVKWVLLCAALAVASIGGLPQAMAAITDDFSDLDDTNNPTWTHLDGLVGSTGQTWDASTGQYHLVGPTNGVTPVPAFNGYGFVGSHVGPSFNDVNVMADFVDFPQGVFGVAARLNGANGLNQLTGYGYVWERTAAGGLGEMVLYQITGLNIQDIGSQQVTLDPNKDYTFVLDIQGNQLHGQVFEIGGGMVAEKFATNNAYASGTSGVFGYNHVTVGNAVDFTIDNFKTQVPEPATALLLLAGASALGLVRRAKAERAS